MLTRKAGLAAAAIAGATSIVYVIIIVAQGEDDVGLVVLVVAIILGAALAAGMGASTSDLAMRRISFAIASGLLLSLGALAIFSIGLLLVVAGAMSTVAWVRTMVVAEPGARGWALAAFIAATAVPFGLLLITSVVEAR
jgi:hypothetical protein